MQLRAVFSSLFFINSSSASPLLLIPFCSGQEDHRGSGNHKIRVLYTSLSNASFLSFILFLHTVYSFLTLFLSPFYTQCFLSFAIHFCFPFFFHLFSSSSLILILSFSFPYTFFLTFLSFFYL